MNITFTKETYKAVQKAGAKSPIFHEEEIWRDLEIESRLILPKDRPLIKELLRKPEYWQFVESRRVVRAIETVEKIEAGSKTLKIRKLPILAEAIKDLIQKLPHKFVFYNVSRYGCYLRYFVEDI